MKLTLEGIKDRKVWEEAGISLPSYDVEAVAEATREKTCVGALWCGQHFPHFYRRHSGCADFRRDERQRNYMCRNL